MGGLYYGEYGLMEVKHNISDEMRKTGCPMGHLCDKCSLYRPIYRNDEKGNVTQIWDCQWNNIAMLMSEGNGRVLGVQRAVESRGNEQIKRADAFLDLAMQSKENASLPRQ